MNISRMIFNSCMGMLTILSLSSIAQAQSEQPAAKPTTASATPEEPAKKTPHVHAEGESCDEHDHAGEAEHKHAEGESCDEHDHAGEAEHKHAEGESCDEHDHAGEAEHKHAEGESCDEHDHAGEAEHKHAEGEECDGHDHEGKSASNAEHVHAEGEECDGTDGAESHAPEGVVSVHVDAKAIRALDMKVEKIVAQPHGATKSYYGQLEIPPYAVQTFALPSSGRVIPHVKSAQNVKKGDILYTLESPDIVDLVGKVRDAATALKRGEAELSTLNTRRDQLNQIGTRNSELDTNIQFKEAELPGLRSALETATSQLQIATSGGAMEGNLLVVRAPASGSVQSVSSNNNAWAEQGSPVLIMTDPGKLEFKATAYASDSLNHSTAHLVLPSSGGKQDHILEGNIRIAAQINPENQTRTLYFVPDQIPAEAFAGQVARLDLGEASDKKDDYIPVPNSAIVKVGVNDVVFLQDKDDDDLFLMVKVETLPARRGMTPAKGIKEGQLLVTKGGYELKYALPEADGAAPKKAAGHFHADGKFHEGEH